jgi:glutathione S-transferase
MPKLVLTYFDLDGSRGEVARLAMHLAGIAFVDKRVAGKDWPALRESTPFQSLPVLEVDGQVIAQSNTINRYLGKLAGLYPKDDWQAARVEGNINLTCWDVGGKPLGLFLSSLLK